MQKQHLLVHRPHDCVLDKGELLAKATICGVSATGGRVGKSEMQAEAAVCGVSATGRWHRRAVTKSAGQVTERIGMCKKCYKMHRK